MKKLISFVIFVTMLVTSFSSIANIGEAPLAPAEDWALDYVQQAKDNKITDPDATYNYRGAITREGFCNLVYNFVINVTSSPVPKASSNFSDTSSTKVNILCDLGIIKGKSQGIFAPGDFLTREETATVVVRLVNNTMPVPVTEMYFAYNDENDISDWATDGVQLVSNMGIMKGTGDNKFSPKEKITTQEVIAILSRLADVYYVNYKDDNNFADNLNSYMPQDKNYMFSPISIKMVLALAANGASGQTKGEITKVLDIGDLDEFNLYSKDLIQKYSQVEHLKLNVANSIWINSDNTDRKFSSDFQKLACDYYFADAKTVNNANAVKDINSWVSDKTNGKIPTVANNSDFWASLINAIYFKGLWKDDFNPSATEKAEFTSADGTKSQIDFMNKTSWMRAYISDDISAVELPYKNRFDNFTPDGQYKGTDTYSDLNVSMYLIMSEKELSPEYTLNDIILNEKLQSTYTRFSMPKFKFDYDTSLNNILQSMGIKDAFNVKDADFTNMFDSGSMFISDAIHKTYISVDEVGTEAAAVTAIMMAGSALPPEPVELKINKPFYFIIRDNTNGESLFVGRYAFA